MFRKRLWILLVLAAQLTSLGMGPAAPASTAAASLTVYADARGTGWDDWSWGGVTHNFASAAIVHSGSASISVQYTAGWSGLQIGANSPPSTSNANTLEFWINGGSSGEQSVRVSVGNNCSSASKDLTLTAATWVKVSLSLAGMGTPASIQSFSLSNPTDHSQPVFYVDDVILTAVAQTPPVVQAGPALSVDAASGRHAISPYIYGMNFPDESLATELQLPVQRWGGNSTTRYNYLNDISNRASDWYFENIPGDKSNPATLPDGSDADLFIEQGLRTGTQTLLTVPLIGWTPKNQPAGSTARICGFSVSKYGPQQSTDPWAPDCGSGVASNGSNITGNNPTDTSIAITPTFVQGWMSYLIGKYGSSTSGGVRFYDLDNEPMLWNSTQRDVHPQPTSYDELLSRTLSYAPAIKAVDPGALTLGPVLWGWTAYFYSAKDVASGGAWWNNPIDRLAHGNVPFVEWYLQQMQAYQQQHGQRILDFLDLHYYPQSFDSVSNNAGDDATQQMRLRSTRSLWDPTYVDESWINDKVDLLPRMHTWVNTDYPGTRLALSEYSWGATCHINGALAQADVLGIFGQQGLDLATLWGPPQPAEPGAFAFRMYRSADGGRGFGEVGVQSASADTGQLAVYGAVRGSDGALTVIVINKSANSLSASLTLTGFASAASARAYRYSGTQQDQIVTLPQQPITASAIQSVYPASSITLYVIPPAHQHTEYLPALVQHP
jgi:hypothetical protein